MKEKYILTLRPIEEPVRIEVECELEELNDQILAFLTNYSNFQWRPVYDDDCDEGVMEGYEEINGL